MTPIDKAIAKAAEIQTINLLHANKTILRTLKNKGLITAQDYKAALEQIFEELPKEVREVPEKTEFIRAMLAHMPPDE